MVKTVKSFLLGGVLALAAGFAQAATLTSSIVSLEVTLDPAISNPGLGPFDFNVGGGYDGSFFGSQQFDVNWNGGTAFRLRSTGVFSGGWAGGNSVSWTISGLSFADDEVLTDVNFTRSFGNVAVTNLTDSSVTFTFDDVAVPRGRYLSFDYITAPAAVPLPASISFLLAAMIGLGALGSRRRQRQTAV